jgi:23S rRNA pseudouridine1911/1915/1917 synthase
MTSDTDVSRRLSVAAPEGGRLDRVVAAGIDALSRSRLKRLILAGEVEVDGRTIRDPSHHVNAGAQVTVRVPAPQAAEPAPEAIPLAIVYEDADLIVIDKPAGLVVHPAAGNWTGTLVNALVAHCGESLSGIGGIRRPGIVHRLDKNTSGLLVAAKTDAAHSALAAQFADHGRTGALGRGYLAFVWGAPDRPVGAIDAAIGRHPHGRDRMGVRPGGRRAVTRWRIVESYGQGGDPIASLLALRLETGRTHQIRVHLAHIGHPILGDETYGAGFKTKAALLHVAAREALSALDGQALHAHILALIHPATGQILQFRSELPRVLAHLRQGLAAHGAMAIATIE